MIVPGTILRAVVGSQAHGATSEASQGDRDEMGVFVEHPSAVCGLESNDHVLWRSKPHGVRSEAGDLDLTMYSLRKFCRLAVSGNPSILMLLWLPEYLVQTKLGKNLVDLREAFVSKEAGERFLGYLVSQKQKMLGEKAHTVNRPDLVAAHGYDTKFAMHAVRLGLEGIQYLKEHRLEYPSPHVALLRDIRNGVVSETECIKIIEDTEQRLRDSIYLCPHIANTPKVQDFLVRAHFEHWNVK